MSYHAKALDLLGKPVHVGDATELNAAERLLGIEFPASVREWYTTVDGRAVLAKYSNNDHALVPAEFRLETVDGKRLVVFLIENQGVCWWGFDLDGGDNPAVYVNLDPPPDDLFVYSTSFSEFTFVRVFDHEGYWAPDRMSLETYRSLEAGDLATLRARFSEESGSSGWPGNQVYRFRSRHGRITIWQSDEQSDWTLSAPSTDELETLQASVRDICRPFE